MLDWVPRPLPRVERDENSMKKIEAIIKPFKLDEVKLSLIHI